MIGMIFYDPFKLVDTKTAFSKNVVNTKGGRYGRKCTANTKAFFKESILHIAPYFKISIRVGYVIQVATKDRRVRAVTQYLIYNICLYRPVDNPYFYFGKNCF